MRRARRPVGTAAALLAALLALSGTAVAHADLMSAEPEPNTELDEAPTELTLSFSEPLEDTYTRVEVLDPNGTDRLQTFTIPSEDRRTLAVDLGTLGDGVHTVEWRALSSADGHTTSGSYLLAVNASLTDEETPDAASPVGETGSGGETEVDEGGPGEAILRGLGFLGASLAAGVPLFALAARGLPVPATVRERWWRTASAGGLLAAGAALGVVGALATRIELPLQAALATTPGRNLLLRAGLFATAGLASLAVGRLDDHEARPPLAATGTAAALAGLLVTSLGSHAAADGVGTGLAITVDWLHQAAVAFWVSGVAALALAAFTDTPVGVQAGLIRRFSPLAVASVGLIVLTGVLASVDRLTTPSDLATSLYGFMLSAKILLLAPLVALGAYHRYRLLPQLEEPGHASAESARLRRSALLELGVMVLVLLAAGAMTTTSPPTPPEQRAPFASFDEAYAAGTPGPYAPILADSELVSLTDAEAENLTLTLLDPARRDQLDRGRQPVWILLTDENGDQPAPVTDAEVEIQAWMTEHGHGTTPETDPVHVHEGMYQGATTWSMPGPWELRVNVTLPEGDELAYRFPVYVEEDADPLDGRTPFHTFQGDGHRIEVFLSPHDPVRIGVQNVTVRVTPEGGLMPENADVVGNLHAPSSSGGEGRSLGLDRWREDAWTREDAVFTEQGTWTLTLALQGKGTYVQTEIVVDVAGR